MSGSFGKNVRKYFDAPSDSDILQRVSDRTAEDLDLDLVFARLNFTKSRVGEQMLYRYLRTIPANDNRVKHLERIICVFDSNPQLRDVVSRELSLLNKYESYYLCSLFVEEYLKPPSWFPMIRVLSLSTILTAVGAFFVHILLIPLTILLVVNVLIHYWNKRNLFQYAAQLIQLMILTKVVRSFSGEKELEPLFKEVEPSLRKLESLGIRMSIFKFQARLETEIGYLVEYVFELLKSFFLLEPLLLFNVLSSLDKYRDDIRKVFNFAGDLDVGLAILQIRRDELLVCSPEFVDHEKYFEAESLRHPLVSGCVPNSIVLDGQSAFITGSNMSGKTTFIRAIGINIILAQTLNVAFSKALRMPRLKVFSVIRITDNIESETSYYEEEVKTVKELLLESRSGSRSMLLMDELFKGTNTIERIAGAKAVLTYLDNSKSFVVASSHDIELCRYLDAQFRYFHFDDSASDADFAFKLKDGVLERTNGIRLLVQNGYPEEVVEDAKSTVRALLENKLPLGLRT